MKRFLVLALCLLSISLHAQPKIGFALGGGGAKGAATIGALKVLEREGIRPDFISGTSIGALVGGLYAAGYTADELEKILLDVDIATIIDSEKVEALIEKLLNEKGVRDFGDNGMIPFKCVAVAMDTMEPHVLGSGSMARAMRASMSIPVVYSPVALDGAWLNDGGLVNNLPVDVVVDMGADIVIAVDLQQGVEAPFEMVPLDMLRLGGDLAGWFGERPDLEVYQESLRDTSIYIHPSLPGYNAASFRNRDIKKMLRLGEEQALRRVDQLRQVSAYSSSGRLWDLVSTNLTGMASLDRSDVDAAEEWDELAEMEYSDSYDALVDVCARRARVASASGEGLDAFNTLRGQLVGVADFFARPFFSCADYIRQLRNSAGAFEGSEYLPVRFVWQQMAEAKKAQLWSAQMGRMTAEFCTPWLVKDAEDRVMSEHSTTWSLSNPGVPSASSVSDPVRKSENVMHCEGTFSIQFEGALGIRSARQQEISVAGDFSIDEDGHIIYNRSL